MLYKVFIDESGKKEYLTPYARDFVNNPPLFDQYEDFWRDNYFVLCGIRIKQEALGGINSKINDLKKDFFGTHKVEVKSDWLRNPHQRKKHYLDPFKISTEKLDEFGEKFIDTITDHKQQIKIIAAVFDKRCYGDAKRQTPEGTPLLKATQILFERIQFAGNYNLLVFDQMESSLKITVGQHGRILNVFRKNEGMQKIYVEKYDRISDIRFMKSENENFLQVADICAYNIFRQFVQFGREWTGAVKAQNGKSEMRLYPYFDRIRCNFYYHPGTQQVRGYGLVCVPDLQKINWNILKGCFKDKKPSRR